MSLGKKLRDAEPVYQLVFESWLIDGEPVEIEICAINVVDFIGDPDIPLAEIMEAGMEDGSTEVSPELFQKVPGLYRAILRLGMKNPRLLTDEELALPQEQWPDDGVTVSALGQYAMTIAQEIMRRSNLDKGALAEASRFRVRGQGDSGGEDLPDVQGGGDTEPVYPLGPESA